MPLTSYENASIEQVEQDLANRRRDKRAAEAAIRDLEEILAAKIAKMNGGIPPPSVPDECRQSER